MPACVNGAVALLLAIAAAGCASPGVSNLAAAADPDDTEADASVAEREAEPEPTLDAPREAAAAESPAGSASEPATVALGPDVEEVTVVADRLLTGEDKRRIYNELAKARRLFARNQIAEAFPYLLHTAERGFKDSQAKVGHIYLTGAGEIERDSEQALGWLGVASSGTTSPTIRNYFNDIWERIPERYVPYFEEVVEEYRRKYGEHATGVVCALSRPLRSNLKTLGCFFEEELPENVRVSHDDYRGARAAIDLAEDHMREMQQLREQLRASEVRGN